MVAVKKKILVFSYQTVHGTNFHSTNGLKVFQSVKSEVTFLKMTRLAKQCTLQKLYSFY